MTRKEFITAAYTDLSHSFEDIDAALSRAFAASPDKQSYTPHDLQALDLSIRLHALHTEEPDTW